MADGTMTAGASQDAEKQTPQMRLHEVGSSTTEPGTPESEVAEPIATRKPVTFPDGGWQAWAAVAGGWLVQFCTFGYTNAFGVYQDFYVREYLTNQTASQISWIGSVQTLLLFSVGLFSGRAFDRGYFYHLMIGGSALFVFCLFMLSISHPNHFYQVFLAQGVGIGIAFGLTFVPALGVISHHFQRRRALAMGIAASGSSLGGVLHPIMLNNLFHGSAGFHTGVRASAGLNLGLLALAIVLMRTRLPPAKPGSLVPFMVSFAKDPPYVFAVTGAFLVLTGLLFPYFYIQLYSIDHGVNTTLSFYTLAIMNGCGVLGRVVASLLASTLGVYNQIVFATFASGIIIFGISGAKAVGSIIVLTVLFGLSTGIYVALLPAMLTTLARDVSEVGARMGICFSIIGFAALIGSPIAGALLGSRDTWERPIIFAGTCMTAGSGFLCVARFLLAARRRTQKV